jgi:hypothetical protein
MKRLNSLHTIEDVLLKVETAYDDISVCTLPLPLIYYVEDHSFRSWWRMKLHLKPCENFCHTRLCNATM